MPGNVPTMKALNINTQNNSTVKSIAIAVASLLVFGLAFVFLSWTSFSEDDSHLLRVATTLSWGAPFIEPIAYQQLSAANYTPFLQTFYKLIAEVFGLEPRFFLLGMLLTLTLVVVLSGRVSSRLSGNPLAPWLVMLLVVSNLELTTLLTRFYNFHYLLGAVFALGAALCLTDRDATRQAKIAGAGLLLLSLLAKEVYGLLLVLFVLMAALRRDWFLVRLVIAVAAIYLPWRLFMLGLPTGSDTGSSYFTYFWQVDLSSWWRFFQWYFTARAVIWIAVVAALLLNARQMFQYMGIAVLLLLPVLAASHGFLQPQMHADRLFFAFDSMLALGAGVALANAVRWSLKTQTLALVSLCVAVLLSQVMFSNAVRETSTATVDYKITQYLIRNHAELDDKVVFVPLSFTQGDLQNSFAALQLSGMELTHNCFVALATAQPRLLVFDAAGDLASVEQLAAQCNRVDPEVSVVIAPEFRDKAIQWHIDIPEGFMGGVYFVDRKFPVPVPRFSRVLARPTANERVQLFVNRGNEWWFSEAMPLQFPDSITQ